jgi:hypothetical protein
VRSVHLPTCPSSCSWRTTVATYCVVDEIVTRLWGRAEHVDSVERIEAPVTFRLIPSHLFLDTRHVQLITHEQPICPHSRRKRSTSPDLVAAMVVSGWCTVRVGHRTTHRHLSRFFPRGPGNKIKQHLGTDLDRLLCPEQLTKQCTLSEDSPYYMGLAPRSPRSANLLPPFSHSRCAVCDMQASGTISRSSSTGTQAAVTGWS